MITLLVGTIRSCHDLTNPCNSGKLFNDLTSFCDLYTGKLFNDSIFRLNDTDKKGGVIRVKYKGVWQVAVDGYINWSAAFLCPEI